MKKYLEFRNYRGWGDIFHTMIMAIAYAEKYNRTLVINFGHFSYLPEDLLGIRNAFSFFFKNIDAEVPVVFDDSALTMKYDSVVHLQNQESLSIFLKKYCKDEEDFHEQAVIFDTWCFRANNFVEKLKMSGKYCKKIKLNDDLMTEIQLLRNKYMDCPVIIGVHLRSGNGEEVNRFRAAGETDQLFQRYCGAIDTLQKRINSPTKIFICSDSPSVINKFKAHYSNAVTADRYHLPNGSGAFPLRNKTSPQVDKMPQDVYLLGKQYGEIKLGREALIDMWLLSYCSYLIHNNSEFIFVPKAISETVIHDVNLFERSLSYRLKFLYKILSTSGIKTWIAMKRLAFRRAFVSY